VADLDYLLHGDADEVITWRGHSTMYGGVVKGSRRSIAHLEATNQACRARFGCDLVVIQSAYNTGVEASAGTHDKDKVYDVYIPGVDWWKAQHFFREQGWAAWVRQPPSFGWHIHMVSLGGSTPVGIYVPGQVADYYAHRNGLAGHAEDDTWHPADISETIFDYDAWKRAQDMAYTDWPKADRDALVSDVAAEVVKELLAADLFPRMDKVELTVQQALKGKAPSKS
jgi:hypothetical protein